MLLWQTLFHPHMNRGYYCNTFLWLGIILSSCYLVLKQLLKAAMHVSVSVNQLSKTAHCTDDSMTFDMNIFSLWHVILVFGLLIWFCWKILETTNYLNLICGISSLLLLFYWFQYTAVSPETFRNLQCVLILFYCHLNTEFLLL